MAYPQNCVPTQTAVDLANRDLSRIVGDASVFTIQKSPFMATIGKGTMENVSQTVRWVAFERALPAASLVRPAFVNDEALCGNAGGVDQVGSTEFTGQLKSIRGRGPLICFKTARTAWAQTYGNLVAMLKQGLVEIVNADIKAAYLDLGGSKMTINSAQPFENIFAGSIHAVGTLFPNYAPDSPVSFRALEIAATYMREVLGAEAYENDAAMAIFGRNQIQLFRDELDIREDMRYLAAGRYQMGEESITGYEFSGPYHGIAFASDPYPLRANSLDVNGQPIFIEPLLATAVTVGTAGRPNSAWNTAQYEVGFLIFKNAFKRLVPEDYKIPGFDFAGPISNEGLKFKVLDDADCNLFNDFGQHLYEITRAYQPMAPQCVCAILYKRCTSATNIVIC